MTDASQHVHGALNGRKRKSLVQLLFFVVVAALLGYFCVEWLLFKDISVWKVSSEISSHALHCLHRSKT